MICFPKKINLLLASCVLKGIRNDNFLGVEVSTQKENIAKLFWGKTMIYEKNISKKNVECIQRQSRSHQHTLARSSFISPLNRQWTNELFHVWRWWWLIFKIKALFASATQLNSTAETISYRILSFFYCSSGFAVWSLSSI